MGFEVHEGPKIDNSVGVNRIRGSALKDGSTGWATLAPNQGEPFLVHGGTILKVSKTTPLLSVTPPKSADTMRTLEEGEPLEVLGWVREPDDKSHIQTAVHVRALSDGASGWAMLADRTGTLNLEVP